MLLNHVSLFFISLPIYSARPNQSCLELLCIFTYSIISYSATLEGGRMHGTRVFFLFYFPLKIPITKITNSKLKLKCYSAICLFFKKYNLSLSTYKFGQHLLHLHFDID